MAVKNAQRYDFRDHPSLNVLVEEAKAAMTEDQRIVISYACNNHKLCNVAQFPPFDTENAYQMTLGELSELGTNDPGIQQMDLKALQRLLFGDYGLITHKKVKGAAANDLCKIAERLNIVYIQPEPTINPEHPAIASGRHRNYALQMLCHAAGVPWELAMEQPIWVNKTIARNQSEFTMMMTLANGQQARRQSAAELKSFDLTKRGVQINDIGNLVASRLQANQTQMADVIATGVQMGLNTEHINQSGYIWDRTKTAWTKACRISPNHKNALVKAFKEDGDQIRSLMSSLSIEVIDIMERESSQLSSKTPRERVNEGLADAICEFFDLPKTTWETAAEKAARVLADLEAKQEELRLYVQS